MPFARPSLTSLVDRIRGDLRGRLSIIGPLVRRAMVDVLGSVWAGGIHEVYGFLAWLALQLFATTAERAALLVKAAMYGITPIPATYAAGNVTATGTGGTAIPINTILRLDATTTYRVTVGQVLAGGPPALATLPVVAVLAGAAGNIPEGAVLTFEPPIVGVTNPAAVAIGGIIGGEDEESTEKIRARFLLRLRQPPEGGADQDYEAWALKAAAGVTRAWVYANELGLGTVVVRFVRDLDAVTIIPDAGEVATVQAAENAQRPITAAVTVLAPTTLAVAFTIHVVPDNADTRVAVTAELADLMRRVAEPGNGLGRGTVLLSAMRTAIGVAAGVTDYTLTVPAASVVPAVGELAVPGAITWI